VLTGRRFLLRSSTIGVDTTSEKRIAVTIPAGVTIEITGGPHHNDPDGIGAMRRKGADDVHRGRAGAG
jgi:hypothetical protein